MFLISFKHPATEKIFVPQRHLYHKYSNIHFDFRNNLLRSFERISSSDNPPTGPAAPPMVKDTQKCRHACTFLRDFPFIRNGRAGDVTNFEKSVLHDDPERCYLDPPDGRMQIEKISIQYAPYIKHTRRTYLKTLSGRTTGCGTFKKSNINASRPLSRFG